MEATGRDRVRGPSWSYRRRHEETGSPASAYTNSSSRSGTIVSTAYTSSASCLSSASSLGSAPLQLESQLGVGTSRIETAQKVQPMLKKKLKQKHIESLVQEFFHASSENCSTEGGGGMKVLESWFSELGVRWVLLLHLADHASAWALGHPTIDEIWSWIRALTQIMEAIRLATSFFPDHGDDGFVGMPGITEEDEGEEEELPPESQKRQPLYFALFFQETLSKMLVFVDVMFSKSLSIRGPPHTSNSLVTRLYVYGALSRALSRIRLQMQFHPPPSVEVEKIEKETESLLLAKQGKAFGDIWITLEETRARVLKSMEEYSPGTRSPQGSSDIHEVTYSVMNHIFFLLNNHFTVTPLVSEAVRLGKYVPLTGLGEAPPFISLITEMVSCLEEKLITISRLFLDKGLRFLFLLNNSNFIRERLKGPFIPFIKVDVAAVTRKVEHYIESYMQVSWGPLLSLFNPTPLCFRSKYSPSSKFESEFQKTYTTQKLWKVPDPKLRKRLRKAVIEKIIPDYTKYIEDSKVTKTKFTPHELEEMLQELFEG